MAKVGTVQTNLKRKRKADRYQAKRKELKAVVKNKELSLDERFAAQLKLNELPRNSSKIRIRNRCGLTGRPRGYYRKFHLSRIALRDLASEGVIPGVIKSSW